MEFMLPDLAPALPEMVLLAMACVVLLVDLFWPGRERSNTYVVSQLSLLATVLAVAQTYNGPTTTFSGHYTVDAVAVVIKVMALLIMFGVFLYGRDYLRQRALLTGEFLLLSLFATLGLLVMASAGSLLVLYLGLEVLSLSSYALVALHRDNGDASEAAIKYFSWVRWPPAYCCMACRCCTGLPRHWTWPPWHRWWANTPAPAISAP